MGIYAYDFEKHGQVEATNAIPKEKGMYLCPTEACRKKGVSVFLRQTKNGNAFVSYDKTEHEVGCNFPTSFHKNYHNAKLLNFNLSELYQSIISQPQKRKNVTQGNRNINLQKTKHPINVQKSINITSIYDLYSFCMSNILDQSLNERTTVKDILIADRTISIWHPIRKNISNQFVLAVGKTFQFFDQEYRIRLMIECEEISLKISLMFSDSIDYSNTKSRISDYQYKSDKGVVLAVFGIANSNQYSFMKKDETITFFEIAVNVSEKNIYFVSKKQSKT